MRAKKVFENIDFERGQDPKSSMKIGIESINLERAQDSITGSYFWKTKLGKFWFSVNKNSKNIFRKKGDLSIKFKDQSYFIPAKKLKNNIYLEEAERFIKELIIKFEDKVYESLDFERGKDPKHSMNIGVISNAYTLKNSQDSMDGFVPTPHKRTMDYMGLPSDQIYILATNDSNAWGLKDKFGDLKEFKTILSLIKQEEIGLSDPYYESPDEVNEFFIEPLNSDFLIYMDHQEYG
ncbi:MAG: hypothetical protein M0R03_20420 [Novosphingobium sp.]|nr:hypothetical protein [Novosphingobium sp.]